MQDIQSHELEGIAVIGMSGRFPKASNLDEFWQNLCDGVEGISFFSEEDLLNAGVDPELVAHPAYVRARGMLEDADKFDAALFGFNPREAELLDPQHRVFLECAWAALECAGYDPEQYKGIIGVFGSVSLSTYVMRNIYSNRDLVAATGDYQVLLSSDKDFIAERVSYKLNLRGPSVAVQTACSSSLVAVHMACRSLLMGESDMVLAGGASISVPQHSGYIYQEGGIMSPDGHCRAFDSRAQGTVRGEGAGVVVLKRLEDAVEDGDTIYAVIKGSAINNDGSFKVGFTAPAIDGQAEVIGLALEMADVNPDTIDYIEAHGTGTPLGDPIEIAALTQVFREYTPRKQFCAIGSVKTSLGHLDAAAGVAGLIKTVLALKHRMIPPSLHYEQPNPTIDFANSPFYVNSALTPWPNGHHPRRAGVSSFGMGGTNVHAVLEEAPSIDLSGPSHTWQVIVLSARTSTALDRATSNLAAFMQQHAEYNIADVAYTYQVGRRALPHRRILLCKDRDDLLHILETGAAERQWTAHCTTSDRPIVFLFPGQGAQYVQMGAQLYEYEPLFRETVDLCADLLHAHLGGVDLRDILYPSAEQEEQATRLLTQTQYTQPALFVIEYALAKLWQTWGVKPAAMIGHSLGEYVAACLAEVLTLEDALKLVALRGKLMQAMEPGAMLSVPLAESDVQPFLNAQLSLAAVNAPNLCVVSGPFAAIDALEAQLRQEGVEVRRLHTSHAFHSTMMEPMLAEFGKAVAQIQLLPPQLPYMSNVSGDWITPQEATDPQYWVQHVRAAVRFGPGVEKLLQQEERVLLEVGPGRTLSALVRRQAAARGRVILTSLRHPQDEDVTGLASDDAILMGTLGRLWLSGVRIEWAGLWQDQRRQRVLLPTYPFERERFWIDPPATDVPAVSHTRTLSKQPDLENWFYTPVWKQSFSTSAVQARVMNGSRQRWLLFTTDSTLIAQLPEQVQDIGHEVLCVYPAGRFSHPNPHTYTLNPRQPEDYAALIASLRQSDWMPDKIVHCWQFAPHGAPVSNGVYHPQAQDMGFYSLLFLVQALERAGWSNPLHIGVVTDGLHQVTGSEALHPDRAMLLGLCKVIPQEYPHISCTSIDMAPPAKGSREEQQLIQALLAELTAAPAEPVVAYRRSQRWVQTFEMLSLPTEHSSRLRDGGVYMILGGLGGIGLTLAEHLARTRQARLVLVGRSALPPRNAWNDWLVSHPEDDATGQKVRAVQALEALGSEVLVIRADVGSLEQMQRAFMEVYEYFGALHGVIHAAGITGEQAFQMLVEADRAGCDMQFQSKVQGLYVLEQVLDRYKLDFCLLVSSLAAVLGGRGLAAYTASSLFMDAFTRSHNQRYPVPWLTVNWDNWRVLADSSAAAAAEQGAFAGLARLAMTKEEGLNAVERILSTHGLEQIIISTADLHTRIEQLAVREREHREQSQSATPTTLHERPELQTAYAPPTNEAEQKLVTIWQELLGIAPIGINDNFFELGGDSLISIQVIARAREAGLEFTPKQVFEHPTIVSLAAVAGTTLAAQVRQEPATGPVPLTPVQHWFFEQDIPERHQWNQAMLFEATLPLNPDLLRESVRQLLHHHDALRLRFEQTDSGWRQFCVESEEFEVFERIDISGLRGEEQVAAIETIAAERQSCLDLATGPLVRVVLFDGGAEPSYLLFIIHHLAVDAVSWRILLEDFQTVYQQRSQGTAAALPAKTTSFKYWSEQLNAYAAHPELEREVGFWGDLVPANVQLLPRDYPEGCNSVASLRSVSVSLPVDQTQALLREVPKVYRTEINDVLLTALNQSFAFWSGSPVLLVDLEGHGREALFDDVDLSRTVGWFTAVYPVVLDLTNIDESGAALKSVKEQLRCIPRRGIGYGVLRYLRQDDQTTRCLRSLPQAEVSFLYLGQFDQEHATDAFLQLVPAVNLPTRHPQGLRRHLIEVSAMVLEQQLQMEWRYSENLHSQDTIEWLANDFIETLNQLIDHCLSPDSGGSTPGDFPLAGLTERQLGEISHMLAQYDELDLVEEPEL